MSANRAIVGSSQATQVGANEGEAGAFIELSYAIVGSDNMPQPSAVDGGYVEVFQLTLSYDDMNNPVQAITSAIRTRENDSALQVFVV